MSRAFGANSGDTAVRGREKMERIAGLLKDLEKRLSLCMRCGMCRAVCPLFAETGREEDVARGKLALLDGLIRGTFEDSAGVRERLERCLLCGSCAASCPSGVKILEIFLRARAVLADVAGLNPVEKALLRDILAHPGRFDLVMEWGAGAQRLLSGSGNDAAGASCAQLAQKFSERHIDGLAPEPFHVRFRKERQDVETGGQGLRIAFFVGCLLDKVYPHVAEAVVRSLKRRGFRVVVPEGQGCCGIPALAAGETEAFQTLMQANLECFPPESFDYLVTACATCTSTLKKLWPAMAGEIRGAQTTIPAEKILDISTFLVRVAGVTPGRPHSSGDTVAVTYHDPCHLRKSLGIFREPRTLIEASGVYRLKEMVDADRCCGCGGSFNLRHYDLSTAVGMRKRQNIVNTGCSVVATSCPACMIHLSDMLSRSGDKVEVRHVIELLDEEGRS